MRRSCVDHLEVIVSAMVCMRALSRQRERVEAMR